MPGCWAERSRQATRRETSRGYHRPALLKFRFSGPCSRASCMPSRTHRRSISISCCQLAFGPVPRRHEVVARLPNNPRHQMPLSVALHDLREPHFYRNPVSTWASGQIAIPKRIAKGSFLVRELVERSAKTSNLGLANRTGVVGDKSTHPGWRTKSPQLTRAGYRMESRHCEVRPIPDVMNHRRGRQERSLIFTEVAHRSRSAGHTLNMLPSIRKYAL